MAHLIYRGRYDTFLCSKVNSLLCIFCSLGPILLHQRYTGFQTIDYTLIHYALVWTNKPFKVRHSFIEFFLNKIIDKLNCLACSCQTVCFVIVR